MQVDVRPASDATPEADVVAVPVGPDGIPGGARSVEGAARVAEEEDLDYTRFFRWHIDAALYNLNPPLVTSLLAVQVPKGRR